MLPSSTGPKTHLLTIASIDSTHTETGVVIGFNLFETHVFQSFRTITGKHFLVSGVVSGSQHNRLLCNEPNVAPIAHLGSHNADHAAFPFVFPDKLLGLRVVDDLYAIPLCLGLKRFDRSLLTGGNHCAVALGRERVCIIGTMVERVVALHDHFKAAFVRYIDHPVHGFFGLIVSTHPLALVDSERCSAHFVVIKRNGIERLDPKLLHHFGIFGIIGAASRNRGTCRTE